MVRKTVVMRAPTVVTKVDKLKTFNSYKVVLAGLITSRCRRKRSLLGQKHVGCPRSARYYSPRIFAPKQGVSPHSLIRLKIKERGSVNAGIFSCFSVPPPLVVLLPGLSTNRGNFFPWFARRRQSFAVSK